VIQSPTLTALNLTWWSYGNDDDVY
jgi:hypothetical protein